MGVVGSPNKIALDDPARERLEEDSEELDHPLQWGSDALGLGGFDLSGTTPSTRHTHLQQVADCQLVNNLRR